MTPSAAAKKAIFTSLFFVITGIGGWFTTGFGNLESIPLALYYGVLLVNTYFAIKTLSVITPKNLIQIMFDVLLAGMYCILAFSFVSVSLFSATSAGLFLIAILKYAHLSRLIIAPPLLYRKIRINALGALLSATALGVAISGFPQIAAWVLCSVFALANVYLLVVNPMYRSHP